ncbi:hypothetical protein AJ80_01488 [Polytolypa hystricis UAMH7299]|uniref:Uncharacterized protein n=1 Tax=Polytolypa hystricis (strain UAMH7299) TaxID=1447883 RepID=A0A2B7YZY4_POLH7|nr:hypothetical protein AJ80_01488 [Polytolypa hystricis UAMH7299]
MGAGTPTGAFAYSLTLDMLRDPPPIEQDWLDKTEAYITPSLEEPEEVELKKQTESYDATIINCYRREDHINLLHRSREFDHSETDKPQDENWTILRVDHLWLWVVDHETIITSSTHCRDAAQDPVLEGIFDHLRRPARSHKDQHLPSSVEEMIKFITDFCVNFINQPMHNVAGSEFSVRQIFTNFISKRANEKAVLFEKFRSIAILIMNGGSPTTRLLVTQQVCLKKSRMFVTNSTSLDLCLDTRRQFGEHSLDPRQGDHIFLSTMQEIKGGDKLRGPLYTISELNELDKLAEGIQSSVNSVLSLEQNEFGISEAESARRQSEEASKLTIQTFRQGKTLVIFTIVTIVFLPMSFLVYFFALNVSVFPYKGDEVFYQPGWIFPNLFGTSAVLSFLVIACAIYLDETKKVVEWIWNLFRNSSRSSWVQGRVVVSAEQSDNTVSTHKKDQKPPQGPSQSKNPSSTASAKGQNASFSSSVMVDGEDSSSATHERKQPSHAVMRHMAQRLGMMNCVRMENDPPSKG